MTQLRTSSAAQEWITHDPDPQTAAELASCSDEELEERFAGPLTFGTAGLRGPLRGGPNGMNLAVVLRTTWGSQRCSRTVVWAALGCSSGATPDTAPRISPSPPPKSLPRRGFTVTLMLAAVPTPLLAFAVRHGGAVAGVQITASHNPPSDNGYKVYFEGGFPIVPPTDREIEAAIAAGTPRRRDRDASPSHCRVSTRSSDISSARPMSGTRPNRCGWR